MNDPSHPKIASTSRKGKEREPAQMDIADKLIALKRKQATSNPSVLFTPRASSAHPTSPRRLHAPPMPNPSIVVSEGSPQYEADPDDFSRRLKISSSSPRGPHARPAANGSPGKLYDPNTDSVRKTAPHVTAEPDAMSDAASSSHSPRVSRMHQSPQGARNLVEHRQLFDPRKHDAVQFSAQNRHNATVTPLPSGRPTPTPKSSGDWVSASSTSSASYAHSSISSNFTLSSATDSSSASSALFDSSNPAGRRSEDSASSANAFSRKLKEVYRMISGLETRLLGSDKDRDRAEDGERGSRGVLIKGRASSNALASTTDEGESERWRKLVSEHQQLAECIREMLALTLAPTVPASLKNIPQKYNLIIRLWSHAFYHLLESLRHAARPPTSSPVALEYLQQFLNYAYVFYGGLIEERNFAQYRGPFLEALGDLSRYWMAVSALIEGTHSTGNTLTVSAVAKNNLLASNTPRPSSPNPPATDLPSAAVSPTPARIDDSPQSSEAEMPLGADDVGAVLHIHNIPSVGQEAARLMELDPDKERWRQVAKDWFARGLAITPNSGKLQHHLGLLCRDKDGLDEELRGVYHFAKSLVAFHPFPTARESVLNMWTQPLQARRQAPDASLTELFVALHGMLFTNIQLDDFKRVLERFQEKLQIGDGEQVEEREWIMMALVNVSALLEYGRATAVLHRVSGIESRGNNASPTLPTGAAAGRIKVLMAKRLDGDMDVDDEEAPSVASATAAAASSEPELPASLSLAMQLAFVMLSHTLRHPFRRPSEYASPTLNPYNTIFLTFLATVLRDPHVRSALERAVPWEELASFLVHIPRRDLIREHQKVSVESGLLLTSGCKPLPEDWCIRGMGWGGKKVFERGFWNKDADTAGEERNIEVEVLDRIEMPDHGMDGIIEDESDEQEGHSNDQSPEKRRWARLARAGLRIARDIHGFKFSASSAQEGTRPAFRVEGALAEKVARWKEEEQRERLAEEQRLRGTKWSDDSMDVDDVEMQEDESDAEDGEADSEEIRKLKERRRHLQALLESGQREAPSRRPRGSRRTDPSRPALRCVPGYSVLVVDTNILLSSLQEFSSLVECNKWTVVVPLPVIMELDSQSSNMNQLGEAAGAALQYISSHVRTHSASLKVLTSRGNYLSNVNVRTEQVDFSNSGWERNMDDLILRAAMWQDEHWMDRSAMLQAGENRDTTGAAKVILLSFDRMLRLKARSKQLDAASEADLAAILSMGS
ncbi:uncharacterized protein BXZ73DRAFT_86461 [Epithele typhae]|uniref:uncharacterized protein n=1 Tax=Epithele typhae TaxID=378194 RepID=UPI00200803A2|nr:uncharacterized protein BXZ73DRAFT_86461 [Epithele typhae]KAH9946315.1 hypothetical protein BXZ73DRAFT_86461 [Epithele typhae]